MSTTVNVYPSDAADYYWRDGSSTHETGHTIAHAGNTATEYIWPLQFNLSAYSGKILVSMKLKALLDASGSNSFSSGDYIGAGLATANTYPTGVKTNRTALNSNEHIMTFSGDTWQEWNIADAWNTLKAGTAYLALYGNEYATFFTNYSGVSAGSRPYIELVYDEGTVMYGTGGAWQRCQVYYGSGGSWVQVMPYYGSGGSWNQIGG